MTPRSKLEKGWAWTWTYKRGLECLLNLIDLLRWDDWVSGQEEAQAQALSGSASPTGEGGSCQTVWVDKVLTHPPFL